MSRDAIENISVVEQRPSGIYAAHMDALPGFLRDGSMPSLHVPIGRLAIDPDLVGRALAEIEGGAELSAPMGLPVRPEEFSENGHVLSTFLEKFLTTCANRLYQAACQDLERATSQDSCESTEEINLTARPYKWQSFNRWHRDYTPKKHTVDLVYLLTILGPPTEFAEGIYNDAEFDGQFFSDPACIQNITTYPAGTITVHDENFTLHQAPPAEHQGEPRIFMAFQGSRTFNVGLSMSGNPRS